MRWSIRHSIARMLVFGCCRMYVVFGAIAWSHPANEGHGVELKHMNLGHVTLESGQVLPEVMIAYETYGQLAPDGRNAILITHGYTSNHHAAGRYHPTDTLPGWWDRLIGPGKAIDT